MSFMSIAKPLACAFFTDSGGVLTAEAGPQHGPAPTLAMCRRPQPTPKVGLLGVASPWRGPSRALLEKSEGVFQVEAPDV
jgi:hypothetical protein